MPPEQAHDLAALDRYCTMVNTLETLYIAATALEQGERDQWTPFQQAQMRLAVWHLAQVFRSCLDNPKDTTTPEGA